MALKQNTRFECQYPVTLSNGAAIGKDRSFFNQTGVLRKRELSLTAGWSHKSAYPPGYLTPYCWYLPTKSGGLACVRGIAGTGALTNPGSLAKGIRIACSIPPNLIENGDFETGDLTDWIISKSSILMYSGVYSYCARQGNYGLSLSGEGADGFIFVTQAIDFTQTNSVIFWYKIDTWSGDSTSIDVAAYVDSTKVYSETYTDVEDWVCAVVDVSAHTGNHTLKIGLENCQIGMVVDVCFDSFFACNTTIGSLTATIEGIGELSNVGNPLAGTGYIREPVVERLVDYTFEDQDISAWVYDEWLQAGGAGEADTDGSAAHSGTWGLKVLASAPVSGDAAIITLTSPAVIPADFYRISFWMKHNSPAYGNAVSAWLSEEDGTGAVNLNGGQFTGQWDYSDEILTGEWVHITFTPSSVDASEWAVWLAARPDPDAPLSIRFEADGQDGDDGICFADDIEVFSQAIVVNGDFETGDETAWTYYYDPPTISASFAHSGSYGARLNGVSIEQAVNILNTKAIEITFWARNCNWLDVKIDDFPICSPTYSSEWVQYHIDVTNFRRVFILKFDAMVGSGEIDDIEISYLGTAQLAGLVELQATLAGAGVLEADINVILELVAALAGSGALTADISAPVALYATITASGSVTAYLYGGMWIVATLAGEGAFDSIIMGVGNLAATINVAGQDLGYPTASQLASAVWSDELSKYPVIGTAGKALASAGSASDPWSTPLPGLYPAGTAGYLIGQTESIIATLAVIRGLSRENFLMKDQVYDSEKRLLSATVCIYESKADCEGDTNPLETYSVTSTYGAGAEFRMVKL